MMSKRPNKKLELILYDTVTNNLPDGIIINDRMLTDGFAKKHTKWTKQAGPLKNSSDSPALCYFEGIVREKMYLEKWHEF